MKKRLITPVEGGKSKTATQQPVNQRKQQTRGLLAGRYKSWQVLSMDLAFRCLERSYRDLWIVVVNRLVSVLGTGTMALPKYRLLGSEVSEMAEYKYPNPNCTN
jgi:hypothetical protein